MIPKCVKGNNMTILRPCSVEDVPSAPANGYLVQESLESYQNGSSEVVDYRCRHGYELLGSDYSSCITDGYWSDLNITCQGMYLLQQLIIRSAFLQVFFLCFQRYSVEHRRRTTTWSSRTRICWTEASTMETWSLTNVQRTMLQFATVLSDVLPAVTGLSWEEGVSSVSKTLCMIWNLKLETPYPHLKEGVDESGGEKGREEGKLV